MGDITARAMASQKINSTKLQFMTNVIINDAVAWVSVSNHSVVTFANNILTLTATGNGAVPAVKQLTSVTLVPGHKILIKAKYAKVTNADCTELKVFVTNNDGTNLIANSQAVANPVINTEYPIAFIATVPAGMTGTAAVYLRQMYPDATTASGKVLQLEDVMAIDLSASHGVGSEPVTASAISADIDTYLNGYFDGEKSLLIASQGGGGITAGQDAELGEVTATSITTDALNVEGTLPSGTLASPPSGLEIGDTWTDTTDSAQYPILRVKVS